MSVLSAQRTVVLISGRGSNALALIQACQTRIQSAEVVAVISDRTDAAGLSLAREHGVAAQCVPASAYAHRGDFEQALNTAIDAAQPTLIVLAGFMRVLSAECLVPWQGRMINIHPSLLPRHRGLHTHARALAAGDAEHGASVHCVTPELDAGPIISQARLTIQPDDTDRTLAERVLALEHRLLPATVALLSHSTVEVDNEQIRINHAPLATPLYLGLDLADDGRLLRGMGAS